MAGGAVGLGFEGTVDGRTSGVSGAKVVAGEDGSDDARPGSVIGKSEMLKWGTTGPFGTAYFSTGGGTFVSVTGGRLRRTFGLVTGGDFNIGLLLVCNVAGAVLLVATELAVAPVLPASSSSSITIGWSASAMVASEEVAASCTARGRSIGDALKISPTLLMGTAGASGPRGLMRSFSLGRHIQPKSAGSLQVRHKASGGTLSQQAQSGPSWKTSP